MINYLGLAPRLKEVEMSSFAEHEDCQLMQHSVPCSGAGQLSDLVFLQQSGTMIAEVSPLETKTTEVVSCCLVPSQSSGPLPEHIFLLSHQV